MSRETEAVSTNPTPPPARVLVIEDETTLADLIARGDVDAPRRADRPEPSITVPTWAGVRLDTLVREVRGR